MTMRLMVQPSTTGPWRSALRLVRAIGGGTRLIRREDTRYRYRTGDLIINFGDARRILAPEYSYVNHPIDVAKAGCKLVSREIMDRAWVPIPDATNVREIAQEWLEEGHRVLARSTSKGHGGAGITAYSKDGTKWTLPMSELPDTLYYTKVHGDIRETKEYRFHVIRQEIVDIQQKMRRRGAVKETNPYIRTHGNGWVYAREPVRDAFLHDAPEAAMGAVASLGLDFGAVDLAVNGDDVRVYEVNTAPGLFNTTLGIYARKFVNLYC